MAKKPKAKEPSKKTNRPEPEPVKVKVSAEPLTPEPAPTEQTPPAKPVVKKEEPPKRRFPTWAWYAIAGGIVLVGGAIWAGFVLFGSPEQTATNTNTAVTNTNTSSGLVARQLDGVMVEPERANPNIFGVMIENLTTSRPPSGLDKASVVYEALAEGGITRFLALFPADESISEIGPVRSARRYYIDYAEEYNKLLYVHVGGSPNALDYLRNGAKVVDFNQFYNSPYFWRDQTRAAPHNLYTSSEKLNFGVRDKASDLSASFTSWPFKDDAPADQRSTEHPEIKIEYSSYNYNVTYKYHPELNRYFRLQGDTSHTTRDGQAIWAKTVAIMYVDTGLLSGESQRLDMQTIGQGRAIVFRDGQAVTGQWQKASGTDRTKFVDDQGQAISFNRGPVWISIIPADRTVTY